MIITQNPMFEGITALEYKITAKRQQRLTPRVNVASFLHLGAGRQSSALAEMMVTGDLPPVDHVIFADTGDEPEYVYAQVEYLKGRLAGVGIPLTIVKKDGLGMVDAIKMEFGRFVTMPLYTKDPITGATAILRRQCTNEFKIVPSQDFVLEWMLEHNFAKLDKAGRRRVNRNVLVSDIYGISSDEKYRGARRGASWQNAVYPLIDPLNMTAQDCIRWLMKHGLRVPGKSSCRVCPYHEDEYWQTMSQSHPGDFEAACSFDDYIRTAASRLSGKMRGKCYLHKSCKALREIDFKALIDLKKQQISMFAVEAMESASCSTDGGFSCMS